MVSTIQLNQLESRLRCNSSSSHTPVNNVFYHLKNSPLEGMVFSSRNKSYPKTENPYSY